jgi:hypothetical protein
MTDNAYQLDPNHPANKGLKDVNWKLVDRNEEHRLSLLPCSRSAGQPLAEKETPAPLTEVQRLFPDRERVARAREFYSHFPT